MVDNYNAISFELGRLSSGYILDQYRYSTARRLPLLSRAKLFEWQCQRLEMSPTPQIIRARLSSCHSQDCIILTNSIIENCPLQLVVLHFVDCGAKRNLCAKRLANKKGESIIAAEYHICPRTQESVGIYTSDLNV